MMATHALSTTQLARLAEAALKNAAALLADARVLLDARRWPRAHALAVLSAEEFGKFYSCVLAGMYDKDDADAWNRFWKDFKAHRPKFTAWAGQFVDTLDWGEVGSDADAEWKRAWDSRGEIAKWGDRGKQAALYVDMTDGNLSVPDLVIPEETARATVDAVGKVVEQATSTFTGDLTATIARAPAVHEFIVGLRDRPDLDPAAVLDELFQRFG